MGSVKLIAERCEGQFPPVYMNKRRALKAITKNGIILPAHCSRAQSSIQAAAPVRMITSAIASCWRLRYQGRQNQVRGDTYAVAGC